MPAVKAILTSLSTIFSQSLEREIACWVCKRCIRQRAKNRYQGHQDTLGGAWSFDACEECQERRGSSAGRVAELTILGRTNLDCLPDDDDWDLSVEQQARLAGFLKNCDANGQKFGRPVHVWFEGAYYTVADWTKTPMHQVEVLKAMEAYKLDWHRRLAA